MARVACFKWTFPAASVASHSGALCLTKRGELELLASIPHMSHEDRDPAPAVILPYHVQPISRLFVRDAPYGQ